MKRFLVILLVAAMLLSLLSGFAGAAEEPDLWDQILAYEKAQFRRTRSVRDAPTAADYAALSADVAAMVMASDDYIEGTCTYDGTNVNFFWKDADGEPQGYFPSLRAKTQNVTLPSEGTAETVSYAERGGSSSGKNVYVIGPWYGSDPYFTNQYKTEGQSIAKTLGGTCTTLTGTKATIAGVAKAMEDGAVVIFDSHGNTDYDQPLDYKYPDAPTEYVYDGVTKANTSYLTLTTGTGLTAEDQKTVTGPFGTYQHAFSYRSRGGTVYCVDGTVIANHMTKNAPNSMLWMPICLGMATDGIYAPLREKGVEVVYGYSQSVTFTGDYEYEEDFWTAMKNGSTVAEAAAAMKKNYSYDPGYAKYSYYNTVAKARKYFVAFPVVVSSEDTYPGQRSVVSGGNDKSYGADSVQTVKSTWKLKSVCEHSYSYAVTTAPTVSAVGTLTGTCSKCSAKTTVALPKLSTENYTYSVEKAATCAAEGSAVYIWKTTTYGTYRFTVTLPKTDTHTYDGGKVTKQATCKEDGEKLYTCTVCKATKTEPIPKSTAHTYDGGKVTKQATCKEDGEKLYTCTVCNATKTEPIPKSTAHTYEGGKVTKQATCKEDGEKLYTCTVCNATKTEPIPKSTAHTYDGGKVTKQATCREDGEKLYTCTVCGESRTEALPKLDCPSARFSDITMNAWYHDAVDSAVTSGLMKGESDTSFAPNKPLTRAMLATILYRVSGDKAPHSHPFTDVPSGRWFSDAIAWAYESGVVNGTSDDTFSPDDNVTREQAAAMLYRFAGRPTASGDVTAFNDADKISAYAVEPLRWTVGEGIINGKSEYTLDPLGTATRAEIAKIMTVWLAK